MHHLVAPDLRLPVRGSSDGTYQMAGDYVYTIFFYFRQHGRAK